MGTDLSRKSLAELERFYEKLERQLELKLRSKQLLSEAIHWMNVRGEPINERRSKQWQKILVEVEELDTTKLEVLRLLDEKSALVRAQEQPGFRRYSRGGREERAWADPELIRRWALRAAAAVVPLVVVCAAAVYLFTRSPAPRPAAPPAAIPAAVKPPAPESPARVAPAVVKPPAPAERPATAVPAVVKPPAPVERPAVVAHPGTAPPAAVPAAPRATKADPSDLELADASRKKKQYRRAEELYRKSIQNQPDLLEAYISLGDLYLETGQYDRAKETFDAAAQRAGSGVAAGP